LIERIWHARQRASLNSWDLLMKRQELRSDLNKYRLMKKKEDRLVIDLTKSTALNYS